MPNFRIYDVDRFINLIEELIDEYNPLLQREYLFLTSTFGNYCEKVVEYLEKSKSNLRVPNISPNRRGRDGESIL